MVIVDRLTVFWLPHSGNGIEMIDWPGFSFETNKRWLINWFAPGRLSHAFRLNSQEDAFQWYIVVNCTTQKRLSYNGRSHEILSVEFIAGDREMQE